MATYAAAEILSAPVSHNATPARSLFCRFISGRWPLLALLLVALIHFYRSPYSASDLEVPPDSVEYALAPLQVWETGRYEIVLEGRGFPSRYPPWFPVGVILPLYALLGADPANAIIPITLFAVAGVGFAWAIGRRISGPAGGVLAALALIGLPTYSGWATQVMSDVPSTALMLAGCLLFLRLRERVDAAPVTLFLAAGALIAATTLFRPVFAAMLLPFFFAAVFPWSIKALPRLVALFVPMAAAGVASLSYNAATFGSPFRNGYHFWLSIPYDHSALVFSLSNVGRNVETLMRTAFPVLLAMCGSALLFARLRRVRACSGRAAQLREMLLFSVLTAGPILVFHLIYFFPADRFFLPLLACSAILAGALIARSLGGSSDLVVKVLVPTALVLAIGARFAVPEPTPVRRVAADRIRANTPEDAIVVSALDPFYLGHFAAHNSSRQIVPLARSVEYAAHVLAPKPLPYSPGARQPSSPNPLRAVAFVAVEQLPALVAEAQSGKRVFLDASALTPDDNEAFARVKEHFRLLMRAPMLYELQPLEQIAGR